MEQIIHLSFSRSGGAGGVADSLAQEQSRKGYNANFIAQLEKGLKEAPFKEPMVTAAAAVDQFGIRGQDWPSLISLARGTPDVYKLPNDVGKDSVVNLHWVPGLNLQTLRLRIGGGAPIFWTLHDMFPLTSSCHQSIGCQNFADDCSTCPAVRPVFQRSVQARFKSKKLIYDSVGPLVFISPSHWLKAIAERSPLTSSYPTISIPNPVGQLFVSEKTESVINDRTYLADCQSYEVIRLLIVASNLDDPIKNVRGVVSQISELSRVTGKVVSLSLVGSGGHEWSSHPSVRLLGRLTQSELTCQYRKTDFLLVPSLGENSPLVIAEAATQGVRAIATNVGGNSELVSTLGDGYIIERVSDLGNLLPNVPWDLEPKSAERLIETSKAVYSPGAVADKYLQTYKKGLEGFFQ